MRGLTFTNLLLINDDYMIEEFDSVIKFHKMQMDMIYDSMKNTFKKTYQTSPEECYCKKCGETLQCLHDEKEKHQGLICFKCS